VRVIGVTKGFGPDAVRAAVDAGLTDLGENYAGELVAKAAAAEAEGGTGPGAVETADVVWHFLGAVQRNKVAQLAPLVGVWQSVARVAEGERIARFAPRARVLVQVETTGLPGRNGCAPAATGAVVAQLGDIGLQVEGLMTVAAPGEGAAKGAFETLGRLADGLGLEERSMGMSDDLEAAVAAGSTMVRIGRALFGPRPPVTAA
jgi:PLP dependent protein